MGLERPFAVAAAVALIALRLAAPAAAEAEKPVAVAARLTQDAGGAALTFDLSRTVEANAYTLSSPDRIVIDLPEVVFQIPARGSEPDAGADSGPVKAFRFGLLSPGRSRIVVDLNRPACPDVASKPVASNAEASRLTIEIKPCDDASFVAAEKPSDEAAAATDPGPGAGPASSPPVIVLDPGHGGVDSGARGLGGVEEKMLALAFCVELKRQLVVGGHYKVLMTRESDQYVDLDDRVAFARAADAALFISVHADALREYGSVAGSTVYTVADRASDAEAARIAAHENAADRDPDKVRKAEQDPGVVDILSDLRRRETRAYAHLFARGLVADLRGATRLNHNPERSAGFVVLKAPEFPSVLIELGYLSNPEDVAALQSVEWRARAAQAVTRSIEAFFARSGPADAPAPGPGVALGVDRGAPGR